MTPPTLSALVVAHDEEANLPACLATLAFCDEVVVLLDRCTDRSADIARAAGAVVVEGAWEREGERRNTGLEACRGDWILEVDCDERVPAALAAEIRAALAAPRADCYTVPFLNYIGTRPVRDGWSPPLGVRAKNCLFRRGTKRWGAGRVHPRIELPARRERLVNAMDHYVDRDVSDLLQRVDRYTSAMAADLRESGRVPGFATSLRRAVSRFFKAYVRRRGWAEGHMGLLLALLTGAIPLLAFYKARLDPPARPPP